MKIITIYTLKRTLFFLATVTLLLLYLLLVDPTDGGLITILVPIAFTWILLFMVTSSALRYLLKKSRPSVLRFVAATTSSAALFFLLLSGIGTISLIDILLTSSLVILMGFYISRLWK